MTPEELIELKEKQLVYESATLGLLQFVTSDKEEMCRYCLLRSVNEECIQAPCTATFRVDAQEGYYIKREMPK